MRINEEIDALEAIGIRSVSYLASTRVLAGVIVAVPLFCVGLMTAYLAARLGTTAVYGQGPAFTTTTSTPICTPPTCCGLSGKSPRWR